MLYRRSPGGVVKEKDRGSINMRKISADHISNTIIE